MADYKTLKGFKVKSLASDPTVDLGQLWYNSASNVWKIVVDDGGLVVRTITTS